MAAPLLTKRRVLAAKIETTAGTAISLAAADATFNVFNNEMQSNIEFDQRESQAGFSPLPGALGQYAGRVTFSTEVIGGSSAPAWMTTFLPACGFPLTSLVASPQSLPPAASGSNTKTLTIGSYTDGIKKLLVGCMGTFVIRGVAGNRMMIDWTFTGLWGAPTDVALLAPTYDTVAPLRFASSGFALHTVSAVCAEFTLDAGNDVQLREDSSTVSGLLHAVIVGRRMTGVASIESQLVAGFDSFGKRLARTEGALAIALGGSGNGFAIAAPKLQFTDVQEASRNGKQMDLISYQLNKSAAAGDDECTLTSS